MNYELRIKHKKINSKTIIHDSRLAPERALFMIRKSAGLACRQAGFTLVELLVSLIVLVAIGSIIGAILFSSLRGASKTNVMQSVRQNGNYAILQLSKTMRSAKSFNGVSTDGVNYQTNCVQIPVVPPSPTPTPIPYSYVKLTSFDDQPMVFSCSQTTIYLNVDSLIDTTSVLLAPNSCSFTCGQSSIADPPTITIKFSLTQANTGTLFAEKKANIDFQTSIAIRNFLR